MRKFRIGAGLAAMAATCAMAVPGQAQAQVSAGNLCEQIIGNQGANVDLGPLGNLYYATCFNAGVPQCSGGIPYSLDLSPLLRLRLTLCPKIGLT